MLIIPFSLIIEHISQIFSPSWSLISSKSTEHSILSGLPPSIVARRSLVTQGSFLWCSRRVPIVINIMTHGLLVGDIMIISRFPLIPVMTVSIARPMGIFSLIGIIPTLSLLVLLMSAFVRATRLSYTWSTTRVSCRGVHIGPSVAR